VRLAGNVLPGDNLPEHLDGGQFSYWAGSVREASYGGQATVAAVSCRTCHDTSAGNDPHLTGEAYEAGSFPLRVPSGEEDVVYLEKSSAAGVADGTEGGAYGAGNACMWCHKSRKDPTNYISTTSSNALRSVHWGPHNGPHADIFTGQGGYHYDGQTYRNSSHQSLPKGCVNCHMVGLDVNGGIGDHSFYASTDACGGTCHVEPITDFDLAGGQSAMKATMRELRTELNTLGYITRGASAPYVPLDADQLADEDFVHDEAMPTAEGLTADQAGALYNYFLIARGGAFGVHNPIYVKELLYDSIVALTGNPPASQPTRP
jgi:hypothetical protein